MWPHLIELTDGHVLRGRRLGVDDEGRVQFESAAAGILSLELDRVRRLVLAEDAVRLAAERAAGLSAVAPIGSDDRVVMRNADALSGFIDSVTREAVVLESGGQALPLGWDAISHIVLPNPATRPAGIWARLTDGTRIRLEQIAFDDDGLTGVAFGDQPVAVEAAGVAAIDYAQKRQLARLGELEIASMSAGSVFGVRFEPVIAAETAALHSPFHGEFSLPAGAVRFVAEAVLSDDPSGWADVEVVIADGRGELARERLNGQRRSAAISVVPRDGRLVIELDSGVNGPVMDRVRLSGAYVLVENQ